MSPEPGPPDWQLERYRLGELPAAEAGAVRRWLALESGRPEAHARLLALERDDARILDAYPARQVAAEVRARLARSRPRGAGLRPGLRAVPALAMGAVLAACLAALVPSTRPPATRVKGLGSPRLFVFRQRAAPHLEVERLQPGTTARHHDLVQLAYQAAGGRYGVIVSIDGRGVVTRHLPQSGAEAVALQPGPAVLPQSYELDDAPAFERFYLVTADAPFAVQRVVDAVRRRHPGPGRGGPEAALLDLPRSLDQSTFVLRKEPAP
ncbi:MAG TPA: ActD-like protein [Vicinamibacteria bacterium]